MRDAQTQVSPSRLAEFAIERVPYRTIRESTEAVDIVRGIARDSGGTERAWSVVRKRINKLPVVSGAELSPKIGSRQRTRVRTTA